VTARHEATEWRVGPVGIVRLASPFQAVSTAEAKVTWVQNGGQGYRTRNESRDDLRRDALTSFLEARVAQGFRVETRTDTQAVIAPPSRRFSFLNRFRGRSRPEREVVSVDEQGRVMTSPAEPVRW